MKYKLVTWNVAGLRACLKKGFLDWVASEKADIICLQETKAMPEQLPDEAVNPRNYSTTYACAEKKGYSGVSVWSHKKKYDPQIKIGLGQKKFDSEGRTIIAEYDKFILITGYFPNGGRELLRVPYKLEYSREVAKLALKLKKKTGKGIIICGDINTAHTEIDLANPKSNQKNTGFLPEERAWIDEFISQGFVDIFRQKNPEKTGQYTWWTFRNDARTRNIGWRLDYFFITEDLVPHVKKIYHRTEVFGSDHCPVVMELDI